MLAVLTLAGAFCIVAALESSSYHTNQPPKPRPTWQTLPPLHVGNSNIYWLGSPVTAKVYGYATNGYGMDSMEGSYRGTDGHVQIGLRYDGVVVWRKRQP